MKTIDDETVVISDHDLKNLKYKFQPNLTAKLDLTNCDFDQKIINEIVLWKVNRYTEIDAETLKLINEIKKDDEIINEELTRKILEKLLNTKGIQLAMASTILRFKNPKIYQIIDQRVYRFLNGENLPVYFSSIEFQINLYLDYLRKLHQKCLEKGIDFQLADRIIYELDREHNKKIKIKY